MQPLKLLVLAMALAGCSAAKDKVEAALSPFRSDLPAREDLSTFKNVAAAYKARLLDHFALRSWGWVTSRLGDELRNQGDSTLLTGLALATLSCEEGQPLLNALLDGIRSRGGMVPRFKDETDDPRKTSRDMVVGALTGLLAFAGRCPEQRAAIAAAWSLHVGFVNGNSGDLGPGSGNDLGAMRWLWERGSEALGVGSDASGKGKFEVGLVGTAASTIALKDPCYPVHLGAVQMIDAARLGEAVNWPTRKAYCDATKGADMPLSDWFCERIAASSWLAAYRPDEWHLRSQRCPAWESADGKGWEHPSVDWLFLYWLASGELP